MTNPRQKMSISVKWSWKIIDILRGFFASEGGAPKHNSKDMSLSHMIWNRNTFSAAKSIKIEMP